MTVRGSKSVSLCTALGVSALQLFQLTDLREEQEFVRSTNLDKLRAKLTAKEVRGYVCV